MANTIVFVISITITLILIHWINPLQSQFIAFPFDILFLGFIILYLPIFFILVIKEKRKIQNGERTFEDYKTLKSEITLKYDIYGKITHFIIIGIIFSYFTLGFLIQNFFIYLLDLLPNFFFNMFDTGDDIMNFTQNFVVYLVGISLIGLLTADFSRILMPKYFFKGDKSDIKRKRAAYAIRSSYFYEYWMFFHNSLIRINPTNWSNDNLYINGYGSFWIYCI